MLYEQFDTEASKLCGANVTSTCYGKGKVERVSLSADNIILVSIKFEHEVKKFSLKVALNNKALTFENRELFDLATKLVDIIDNFIAQNEEERRRLAQVEAEKFAKRKAEEEAAAAAMKEQQKFEKAKKRAIENFHAVRQAAANFSNTTEEYYFTLGWLASHVRTISARLPDYLGDVFTSYFGAHSPRTLVNTRRKTIGGFKPQWSYAFSASLKNVDSAPKMVLEHLNEAKTKISDTSFIWSLVESAGFVFGKSQDVSKIRNNIPSNMVEWFDEGFSVS